MRTFYTNKPIGYEVLRNDRTYYYGDDFYAAKDAVRKASARKGATVAIVYCGNCRHEGNYMEIDHRSAYRWAFECGNENLTETVLVEMTKAARGDVALECEGGIRCETPMCNWRQLTNPVKQ